MKYNNSKNRLFEIVSKIDNTFKVKLHENDAEHAQTLQKTGFWGKAGAGAIVLNKNTKKFLLPFRSSAVEQPNTWGTWGGAIDEGDSPEQSVRREVLEEAGYQGDLELIPLHVYVDPKGSGFRYYNFLAIVEDEFKPTLNWETENYGWFEWNNFPNNLHFGLKGILTNSMSVKTIEDYLNQLG